MSATASAGPVAARPKLLDRLLEQTTVYELPFFVMLCLLAASIPNESLFGGYDSSTGKGFRSPSYYLGLGASVLSTMLFPRMARACARSMPMVLLVSAFSVSLVVLTALVLTTDATYRHEYQIDRQYKSVFMAVMFIVVTGHQLWRKRVMQSYLVGWFIFVVVALGLVVTGRATTVQHFNAARISVLGMNENVQSTIAGSGAVMCLNFALFERRSRHFALWAGLYVLGLAAFVIGTSRTGLVGLVAGHLVVIVMGLSADRKGAARLSRLRVPVIVIGFFASALAIASQFGIFDRAVTSMGSRSEAAFEGTDLGHRDQLARATLRIFTENPAGVGMGRTMDFLQGSDPHNGYLKLAAEGGVAGMLLFVFAMLAARRNASAWMRADADEIGIAACFVLYAFSGFTGQALQESPFWFFFAFLAVLPGAASLESDLPRAGALS